MNNIAVILAGGNGSRVGNNTPKQFLHVAGKMIIEHTVNAFENIGRIDEICIVCRNDYIPEMHDMVRRNRFRKVTNILPGGKERYHSTLAAVNAYNDDSDNLLFHDAVRPLVSPRIINDCIDALALHHAVAVGVPVTDTVWNVCPHGTITDIPPRQTLYNAQTPQCFRRATIKRAYDLALADPAFQTTDDCGVVKRYLPDEPVFVVQGEHTNIKLTYQEDLTIIEQLFKLQGSSLQHNCIS